MKRQNVIAVATVAVLLALASLLAGFGKPPLRLVVTPKDQGKVVISLSNGGRSPVEFYDSLSNVQEHVPPSLTSIRLRDASGQVMQPDLTVDEGWWYPDYSLVRRVPVILDTLRPGSSVGTTTELSTLLFKYPDDAWPAKATQAQIRCAVYLREGVAQTQTEWFDLPPLAGK